MTEKPLPDDVAALIAAHRSHTARHHQDQLHRDMHRAWKAIADAHDHTTSACEALPDELIHEYALIALADAAETQMVAAALVKDVTTWLAREGISYATIAKAGRISTATVSRWAAAEDE